MNKIKDDLIKKPDLKRLLLSLPHYQQIQLSVILAKDVLPIFEEVFPNDNRPRKAIEAAEVWLRDSSKENAKKAGRAGDEAYRAGDDTWDAYHAADAAWRAGEASNAAASAAWSTGWAAEAVDYSVRSKFYKTIPDKQKFIKMLGRSR